MTTIRHFFILVLVVCNSLMAQSQKNNPLRIGVAGLSHDHVNWIFNSAKKENIEIAGIAEPDRELAKRYADRYNFPLSKIYVSLDELIRAEKPEAVAAFNSIAEHREVVEKCAPKGIHVMVEKPLAVSFADALGMQKLAKENGIFLVTNYETTWYPSVHKARALMDSIGPIRKMVIHDGHQGPKEIGVSKNFFNWLTDPKKNGAGALVDFGCYGADLSSWLMKGERPLSVTAVTQQIKPDIYPKVDDEATIILTYPNAQAIIQASWNWPLSRKDMEVYGRTGMITAKDRSTIGYRFREKDKETIEQLSARNAPYDDPFSFLRAVVRKEITIEDGDLSSLNLNVLVVEILEAAKQSAKEARTIWLKKSAK